MGFITRANAMAGSKFSRKSIMMICVLAFSFAWTYASAQEVTMTNAVEAYNIHAYLGNSSKLSSQSSPILEQLSESDLSTILPHAVLLENGSTRKIWSITVIYTFPGEISASGQAKRHIVSRTAPLHATADTLFLPGDQLLVTPLRGFSIMSRPNKPVTHIQNVPLQIALEAEDYKRDYIDTGKKIEVKVDSVVFDDGEIIGPDTAGYMETLNNRLDADQELLDGASALRGQPLKDFLQTASTRHVVTDRDIYFTSLAGNLLALLNADGEEAFLKTVSNIRTNNPYQGNRVNRRTQK
jgi:hypothetical protein